MSKLISKYLYKILSARLPGLPTLTSTLKHGHLHQYAGFEMSFHCSSFTDRGAKLSFRIHKSYGVTEIYSSSAIYGGVKFTLEEGEFCTRLLAHFQLKIKFPLQNPWLRALYLLLGIARSIISELWPCA